MRSPQSTRRGSCRAPQRAGYPAGRAPKSTSATICSHCRTQTSCRFLRRCSNARVQPRQHERDGPPRDVYVSGAKPRREARVRERGRRLIGQRLRFAQEQTDGREYRSAQREGTPMSANGLRLALSVQYAVAGDDLPARTLLRRWAAAALERDARVTVRFVDAVEARTLNQTYRGIDDATNVLAFVYDEVSGGDIVL